MTEAADPTQAESEAQGPGAGAHGEAGGGGGGGEAPPDAPPELSPAVLFTATLSASTVGTDAALTCEGAIAPLEPNEVFPVICSRLELRLAVAALWGLPPKVLKECALLVRDPQRRVLVYAGAPPAAGGAPPAAALGAAARAALAADLARGAAPPACRPAPRRARPRPPARGAGAPPPPRPPRAKNNFGPSLGVTLALPALPADAAWWGGGPGDPLRARLAALPARCRRAADGAAAKHYGLKFFPARGTAQITGCVDPAVADGEAALELWVRYLRAAGPAPFGRLALAAVNVTLMNWKFGLGDLGAPARGAPARGAARARPRRVFDVEAFRRLLAAAPPAGFEVGALVPSRVGGNLSFRLGRRGGDRAWRVKVFDSGKFNILACRDPETVQEIHAAFAALLAAHRAELVVALPEPDASSGDDEARGASGREIVPQGAFIDAGEAGDICDVMGGGGGAGDGGDAGAPPRARQKIEAAEPPAAAPLVEDSAFDWIECLLEDESDGSEARTGVEAGAGTAAAAAPP